MSMLQSTLNLHVNEIAEFLTFAEIEPRAFFGLEVISELLELQELEPARHPSRNNNEPSSIFTLPSNKNTFCQFGYLPDRYRTEIEGRWEDWRRFRCYIGYRDSFWVINFVPKAWSHPTSYFVNLIDVVLLR